MLPSNEIAQKNGQSSSASTLKYASARLKLKPMSVNSQNSVGVPTPTNKQPAPSSFVEQKQPKDNFRLVSFLINEFHRKKDQSFKSAAKDEQPQILIDYWRDSLSGDKLLKKLIMKEEKHHKNLSEKERMLKEYLNEGNTKPALLTLNSDSTTRKYGELAAIKEEDLLLAIKEYLNRN